MSLVLVHVLCPLLMIALFGHLILRNLKLPKREVKSSTAFFNSSVRLQKVILRVLLVQQVVSLLQTSLATRCLRSVSSGAC